MRFNFTGTIRANDIDAEKSPLVRKGKTKSGNSWQSLNISVAANSNRAFLELFGSKNDTIKTKNSDGEDIEIDWSDRTDKDVIKDVAEYRKFLFVDGDDRHEFISEYDLINHVVENIDDIKGKKFTVTGTTSKNFYNGKVSDRFKIQRMYTASDDRKDSLTINTVLYLTKDSIDTSDWKEEKKIILNGWTQEYISAKDLNEDKGSNRYVPMTIIFDCSKINFDNEKHIKQLQFRLNQIGLSYEKGKIANNIKAKKVLSNAVTLRYLNGAERKEFDESQLTDIQRQKVELGLAEVDDFRPAGDIYGERITEYRLIDIPLTGDFTDGFVYLDEALSEFEEDIFEYTEDEEIDEDEFNGAMNEPEEKKSEEEDDDDEEDLEDLF